MRDRQILKDMIGQSITKVFDVALTEFRMLLSAAEAAIDAEDVEKYREKVQKLENAYALARKKILDVGNGEIRRLRAELNTWKVRKQDVVRSVVKFEDGQGEDS